jgi:hypothetical protein
MKTVISVAVVAITLFSCAPQNEIQVEFVNAELVKIDTVFRISGHEQVLTWRTPNNVQYISYAPIEDVYMVGSRFPVMVKR